MLAGALVLIIRAVMIKDRRWIIFSSFGLLGILVAGGSGATFIPTQSDIYSYTMSLAFMVALISYGCGLYFSHLNL